MSECIDCTCDAKAPCNEEKRTLYEVTMVLSDKCWNEELQRYLLPGQGLNGDNKVVVSKDKEVTLTVEDIWRVTDKLYDSTIVELKIKLL